MPSRNRFKNGRGHIRRIQGYGQHGAPPVPEKLSEQRIFPAIDITKSGTRREELLLDEDELSRIWLLRRRIVNVDESGALNLIIDKLKQSGTNRDFLLTIKKS